MNSGRSSGERTKSILFIILISIYVILLIPQIQKLFIADESAFVKAAVGISTTGLPVYSSANNEIQYALWHPPLYLYMLAASFKILGVHEWSARILSVMFTLATLFIIYRFAETIYNNRSITFLSCFLFLLNPLIVQGSLLIDIDNSILMFLMTLFIYIYYIIDKTKKTNLYFLGIFFGIVLWAKLPTPPLIILSIIVFNLMNRNLIKGITESLIIGLVGMAFFLSTWFVYTDLFNLPFLKPFIHSSNYFNSGGNILNFLLTHLWGLKNIIFWANPFFILSVFITSAKRAQRYMKIRQLEVSDLLLITGLLIFFQYLFVGSYQTQDFPKYFIPMMPLFSIVVAGFIGGFTTELKKEPLTFGLIFSLLFVYIFFFLGDPLLIDRIIFDASSVNDILIKTDQTFLLYMLSFLISYVLFRIIRINNAMINALFISLLALNIGLDISHSRADYSTGYFHGERGMEEAITYLRPDIKVDDAIIAREDVAYYLSIKKYYSLPADPEEFEKLIINNDIKYIIINKNGYFTARKFTPVLEKIYESFELKTQFYDFKVFKKRS